MAFKSKSSGLEKAAARLSRAEIIKIVCIAPYLEETQLSERKRASSIVLGSDWTNDHEGRE